MKRELDDVMNEFEAFVAKDIQEANTALAKKNAEAIHPLTREEWDKANAESGSSSAAPQDGMRWRGRDFCSNSTQLRERD